MTRRRTEASDQRAFADHLRRSEYVTVQRIRESDGRCRVFLGGVLIGTVIPSDRRWVKGWRIVFKDERDLGDQPRRKDAITFLVSFATSPARSAS